MREEKKSSFTICWPDTLVEKQNVQNVFLFLVTKSKNRTSISDESTDTDILRHSGSLGESGGKAREEKASTSSQERSE